MPLRALILEQMYADHQCQQKHHALTADGEQEGRYDFTSCLEQHREQEHHAAKGCGVDLTAHKAPQWMLDAADYSTEMKCCRHPYQKGIKARKGIEY